MFVVFVDRESIRDKEKLIFYSKKLPVTALYSMCKVGLNAQVTRHP